MIQNKRSGICSSDVTYTTMYLKYNREEITWIDPQFLTKEVAKDLAQFWIDTDADKLCTARMEPDGSIAHYWFDTSVNQWLFLSR